jgi:hypothetical protein
VNGKLLEELMALAGKIVHVRKTKLIRVKVPANAKVWL